MGWQETLMSESVGDLSLPINIKKKSVSRVRRQHFYLCSWCSFFPCIWLWKFQKEDTVLFFCYQEWIDMSSLYLNICYLSVSLINTYPAYVWKKKGKSEREKRAGEGNRFFSWTTIHWKVLHSKLLQDVLTFLVHKFCYARTMHTYIVKFIYKKSQSRLMLLNREKSNA